MLKNLGYVGTYHDNNISVNVLLENPIDYGLEPTALVFSITLKAKNDSVLQPEDFTFYIMDETDRLYNTQAIPNPTSSIEAAPDDEPVRQPDMLIHTDFQHEFLFQDLRIAFYYRPYMKISIIKLKH